MGKAIVVGSTLVLLTVIVSVVIIWWRRRDMDQLAAEKGTKLKGDLGPREEKALKRQLAEADEIFYEIIASCSVTTGYRVEDITVLRADLQERINKWRQAHRADV